MTAQDDPSVLFCNEGDAFTAATYSNYASSAPDGSAVHPGDVGLTALWTRMEAFLDAELPGI